MSTTAEKKISKARTALILEQPFFGTLALRLQLQEKSDLDTITTNGKQLIYNAQWINEQSDAHLKTIVAHEIMHIATLHHTRRGNRDPKEWNEAADFAINPILADSGFKMPDTAFIDNSYRNVSAEEIYSIRHGKKPDPNGDQQEPAPMPKPGQENQQQQQDCGGTGSIQDLPAQSEAEIKQEEAETRLAVKQAAQAAQKAGKLSAGLSRMVEDIVSPKIPWREILRRFIDSMARDDYSWSRPNRRHIANGLYLPSVKSDNLPPLVVAIDTSGSITRELLRQFSSELQAILDDCPISSLKVLYCDSSLIEGPEYTKGEHINLKMVGGGGTDFQPVFDWIAEHNFMPCALVYLTDGYGPAPTTQPEYPVLWTLTRHGHAPVAWGESIEMYPN